MLHRYPSYALETMKAKIILWVLIVTYIFYFSYFSILRYKTLNASYYDLGIMHQTVYNSYQAIRTGDWSRFLELTNPTGTNQIKRMAIHNDVILGLLSLLYFVSATPTTLVIFQTIMLALGAWYIFHISLVVCKNQRFKDIISLFFAFCYLMYVPMQRSNMFDFHAVVLSTTLLLGFIYYWMVGRIRSSFGFLILSLLTKEQIGFTTTLTGVYMFFVEYQRYRTKKKIKNVQIKSLIRDSWYPLVVIALSLGWSLVSFAVIIPFFRGGEHFAIERYDQFGGSTGDVIKTLLFNPLRVILYLVSHNALDYIHDLLVSLSFLSLLSPVHLLLALPELAINLLSNNGNSRNIFFHYTAVIQPFVFLSAIYGLNLVLTFLSKAAGKRNENRITSIQLGILTVMLFSTLWISYNRSPLIYSKEKEAFPSLEGHSEVLFAQRWERLLQADLIKVSTTGHLAPYFTSRRFFYDLSIDGYQRADYVVLSKNEIFNSLDSQRYRKAYDSLRSNPRFSKIEENGDIEVYQKQ